MCQILKSTDGGKLKLKKKSINDLVPRGTRGHLGQERTWDGCLVFYFSYFFNGVYLTLFLGES